MHTLKQNWQMHSSFIDNHFPPFPPLSLSPFPPLSLSPFPPLSLTQTLIMQIILLVMRPTCYNFCKKDNKVEVKPATGRDDTTLIDMTKNELYGIRLQQINEQQPHTAIYEEVPSH